MAPKSNLSKTPTNKRSVTVVASTVSRRGSVEGTEETEIHAQVHLPEEGGWGWVVVTAAFFIAFIMDGISMTFGSIRPDMTVDLNIPETMTALINSVALALLLITGPLVSALINRFGFRACTMTGSIICSLTLFTSYFLTSFGALIGFYGIIYGLGLALINLSNGLVVGFYFEKKRAIAIALAALGSSFGVTVWYPVNTTLCQLAGWRSVTLLHSGMYGLIYFLAMTFRPLLALHVVKTEVTDEPTRTVTYLPNVAATAAASQGAQKDSAKPTTTERLFAAVKNDHFPTAAAVVKDNDEPQALSTHPGTSAGPPRVSKVSKLTITAMTPKGGISKRHLQQVKSMMSKTSVSGEVKQKLQITIPEEETKKTSCWGRCCRWEQHVPESRPMYRDDAFYDGKIENLPEYQKSKAAVAPAEETGLEYQLAVSRAAATQDLQERRGVFTTAVRRILATMMDPKLLKLRTFKFICGSGFFVYLGFLVPYSYIQVRNLEAGIDPRHCSLFVSAMGGCNGIGRLSLGFIAAKVCPIKLTALALCTAGVSTMLSNISFNTQYQYVYCGLYGFCVSSIVSLRALVLVKLYGLDKLTNATGMIIMFQGLGSLISTPLAGFLKNIYGFSCSFIVAGVFILCGGLMLIPVYYISLKEHALTGPSPPPPPPSPKKSQSPHPAKQAVRSKK